MAGHGVFQGVWPRGFTWCVASGVYMVCSLGGLQGVGLWGEGGLVYALQM